MTNTALVLLEFLIQSSLVFHTHTNDEIYILCTCNKYFKIVLTVSEINVNVTNSFHCIQRLFCVTAYQRGSCLI